MSSFSSSSPTEPDDFDLAVATFDEEEEEEQQSIFGDPTKVSSTSKAPDVRPKKIPNKAVGARRPNNNNNAKQVRFIEQAASSSSSSSSSSSGPRVDSLEAFRARVELMRSVIKKLEQRIKRGVIRDEDKRTKAGALLQRIQQEYMSRITRVEHLIDLYWKRQLHEPSDADPSSDEDGLSEADKSQEIARLRQQLEEAMQTIAHLTRNKDEIVMSEVQSYHAAQSEQTQRVFDDKIVQLQQKYKDQMARIEQEKSELQRQIDTNDSKQARDFELRINKVMEEKKSLIEQLRQAKEENAQRAAELRLERNELDLKHTEAEIEFRNRLREQVKDNARLRSLLDQVGKQQFNQAVMPVDFAAALEREGVDPKVVEELRSKWNKDAEQLRKVKQQLEASEQKYREQLDKQIAEQKEEIQRLQKETQAQLDELHRQYKDEKEQSAKLQALVEEKERQIEDLNKLDRTTTLYKKKIKQIESDYNDKVEELKQQYNNHAEYEELVRQERERFEEQKLEAEHRIRELQRAADQWSGDVESQFAQHTREIEELEAKHADEIVNLQARPVSDETIKQLQAEHARAKQALAQKHIDEHKRLMNQLDQRHKAELAASQKAGLSSEELEALQAKHKREIEHAEAKIKDLEQRLDQKTDVGTVLRPLAKKGRRNPIQTGTTALLAFQESVRNLIRLENTPGVEKNELEAARAKRNQLRENLQAINQEHQRQMELLRANVTQQQIIDFQQSGEFIRNNVYQPTLQDWLDKRAGKLTLKECIDKNLIV